MVQGRIPLLITYEVLIKLRDFLSLSSFIVKAETSAEEMDDFSTVWKASKVLSESVLLTRV